MFFTTGPPKVLYVRCKPAPHQKINQQTCDPSKIEVKSPKTCGGQISIQDISNVIAESARGWDEKATLAEIVFV